MSMDRELLLDNEFASLWFYPEPGIVHHEFHEPISGQDFKDVLLRGLKLFQAGRATKWLSDDRGNTMLPPEDSAWSSEWWLPIMVAAGWTHWAIVLPETRLGQVNMKRLIGDVLDKGVTAEAFSDPVVAMAWLRQQ
jgi:hypothetical protein